MALFDIGYELKKTISEVMELSEPELVHWAAYINIKRKEKQHG